MDNHEKTQREREYLLITKSVLISVASTLLIVWLIVMYAPQHIPGAERVFSETPVPLAVETPVASGEPVADVVEKAAPAVVSIVLTAEVPIVEQYFEEYDPFGSFFGPGFGFQIPREREIGTEEREVGGGTGFLVSPDGYIVTNRHVVDIEDVEYSVVTNDGVSYDVEVIARDPSLDIAILKIDGEDTFPYLEFGDSDDLRLGETVIAIGNALAEFPNSVSVGVISGLSRNIVAGDQFGAVESLEGVIQTDAAINRGNSGGPLLNREGKVIGVNVAAAGGVENIGFALPGESVERVFRSVAEHGEIVRPFIGIRYVTVTERIARENNLSVDYGVLIVRGDSDDEPAVIPGSPADEAGLQENDIILEFNGTRIDEEHSLAGLIREQSVGDEVMLKVLHNGEEREMTLTLKQAPNE